MKANKLSICHDCDVIQTVVNLPVGAVARCVCCGARLFANPKGGLDVPLALSLSALVFLVLANSFPFLSLNMQGNVQTSTLTGTALAFLKNDQLILAFVVWFSTVIAPGIIVFGLSYVLFALRFGINLPYIHTTIHAVHRILPWVMMDVFILGALVALVKLSSLADISLGVGLYAFIMLIVLFSAIVATIEPHLLWERLDSIRDKSISQR